MGRRDVALPSQLLRRRCPKRVAVTVMGTTTADSTAADTSTLLSK